MSVAPDHLLQSERSTSTGKKFLVRASYLEIYKEEIRDLISKASRLKLRQKNSTFYVEGLSSAVVKSARASFLSSNSRFCVTHAHHCSSG